MKKEDTKKFEEMSAKVLGHKYAYRKLMRKGIVYDRKHINPKGPSRPAFIARRQPLTPQGVWAYMEQTLQMREKIQKDLEDKKKKQGS